MNNLILIAVGGTGARIAQSVVAMAAAGLPAELGVNANGNNTQLYVKLVDIDVNHRDGRELYDMIESYNATIGDLIRQDAAVFGDQKWRPIQVRMVDRPQDFVFDARIGGAGIQSQTVEDIVTGLNGDPRLLLNALISSEDRNMNLLAGCKARPRIGALLWQYLYNDDAQRVPSFWGDVRALMVPGNTTKIMFAGSVFGGTGASGVPTLAKLLRNTLNRDAHGENSYGITLMTPYFQLTPPDDAPVQSKKFPFESKMAMRYYENDPELLQLDCVQIVGDELQTMHVYVGNDQHGQPIWKDIEYTPDNGGMQNNPSMPSELVAAIGIHAFFAAGNHNDFMLHGHEVLPKQNASRVHSINMFPNASQSGKCLGRLARFCHIMLDYCDPLASEAPDKKPALFHKLWEEERLSVQDWKNTDWTNETQGIGHILNFSKQMNRWLDDLEHNGMKDVLKIKDDHDTICNAASHGSTNFECHGVKGSRIFGCLNGKVNSFFKEITNKTPAQIPVLRQRALMRALIEACSEAK